MPIKKHPHIQWNLYHSKLKQSCICFGSFDLKKKTKFPFLLQLIQIVLPSFLYGGRLEVKSYVFRIQLFLPVGVLSRL
jgi:hypothetical protein